MSGLDPVAELVRQLNAAEAKAEEARAEARRAEMNEAKIRHRAEVGARLALSQIGDMQAALIDANEKIVSLRGVVNEMRRQLAEGIEVQ